MQYIIKTTGQIFLLWLIYFTSTWITETFHLAIPGSVLGMLVLFALLSGGLLKEEWIALGANPLLKHLAFFFIPIAVGLMEWGDFFIEKGALLFFPLVISTVVALLATGTAVQFLTARSSEKKERRN